MNDGRNTLGVVNHTLTLEQIQRQLENTLKLMPKQVATQLQQRKSTGLAVQSHLQPQHRVTPTRLYDKIFEPVLPVHDPRVRREDNEHQHFPLGVLWYLIKNLGRQKRDTSRSIRLNH